MRTVINKLITEEDLYGAVDAAFSQGWRRVKLYFLIGLPTERDEDVLGIAQLGARCAEIGRRYQQVGHRGGLGRRLRAEGRTRRSSGSAWTRPPSWSARSHCCGPRRRATRGLTIRWHEPSASVAEGLASRGDRRMGAVIERVWRAGGTFQEWSERFDLSLWEAALAAEGLSLDEVCHRERAEDEALPWDHISAGLHRDFLWGDWQDALARVSVEDCRWTPCYDCGACTGFGLEHVVASAVPPAGGSQGTGQDLAAGDRDPGAPGRPCFLRASGASACASPRRGRSASRATATSPACGSGPCGAAACPVAYSQGFVPHPLVSFGLALPTGCESHGEYLDLRLGGARRGRDPGWRATRAFSAPCCPRGSRWRRRPWSMSRRARSSRR